jgi:hypothetical protein
MNMAESNRIKVLHARVDELEKLASAQAHEIANLKQIVEILTSGPKDRETLRVKKSG